MMGKGQNSLRKGKNARRGKRQTAGRRQKGLSEKQKRERLSRAKIDSKFGFETFFS